MINKSVAELIGKTPILELGNIEKADGLFAKVLVKLECFNPAGSAKDRIALHMIEKAESQGILKEGATVIEPTSGNTGIGIAAVCASRGYKAVLTMPDTMSVERQRLLTAYGAKIVLTDGKKGMAGAVEKAIELKNQTENSFIPSQFDNPDNPETHYLTTGPEIYEQTEEKIDVFVAGIGTGGTVSGIGKYLKEKNKDIEIIGIEPADSPLITKGIAGGHKLQGIGANFIPKNYDGSVVDEVLTVTTEQAYSTAKRIAHEEGILVGITSGAAAYTAIELAKSEKYKNKTIVAFLPDGGDRYMSLGIYDSERG